MSDSRTSEQRTAARLARANQRIDAARAAADRLWEQEKNNAGSGRDGHLNEDDLMPLFTALGAVFVDDDTAGVVERP